MVQRSKIADEIVSVVGYPAARRLFDYYGGKQVTIPDGTGRPGLFVARLIELLGEAGFKSLIARFGGENITIPRGYAKALMARNRAIVSDYGAGLSFLDLIHRYQLSERQIRTILNRPVE